MSQFIEADYPLVTHNSFGLSSTAQFALMVSSKEHVVELAAFARRRALPIHMIGTGSNLLLRPQVAGVVGLMAIKGRSVIGSDQQNHYVKAAAGEDWSEFVAWTLAQGFPGLENLAGIPGTVGAAPVQNIGAYGVELADRFHALTAYDIEQGETVSLRRDQCRFSYRHSIFKQSDRFIVLDVTFALPKNWRPVVSYQGLKDQGLEDAKLIMDRVLSIRQAKLPDWRKLGNAGSFFHNPVVSTELAATVPGSPQHLQHDGRVKLSAAWLIDACGLKGRNIGGAAVYQSHALIIVNRGNATYDDVSTLAESVSDTVAARFGVSLVQEPLTL